MTSAYFAGEKDTKKQAIESASKLIRDYSECVFNVTVNSDGGGHVLEVMVEVQTPLQSVLDHHPDFPLFEILPKWHGWRSVIMKVPIGYIGAIVHRRDDD
jgi:hypothetical protein|tara:strand:+ start:2006 stop:2305 length:300 start_codon:yes stop_codon:yes gene_type:complete